MTERQLCESDGATIGHRVRYNRPDAEPPSIAVGNALAKFRGEDPTTTSIRLYDYVDPDGLDALFTDTKRGGKRSVRRVEFEVEDASVVVGPDRIEVACRR